MHLGRNYVNDCVFFQMCAKATFENRSKTERTITRYRACAQTYSGTIKVETGTGPDRIRTGYRNITEAPQAFAILGIFHKLHMKHIRPQNRLQVEQVCPQIGKTQERST